ncbi:MAG TPA: PilN domain-containing protein [Gemmatimonadales bacterium]|nr:PilN domain-containing protein [Gemmatimonadales bacterium]
MMITVNLRPGLKRKRSRGSLFANLLERMRGAGSGAKDPLLLGAVGAWVLAAAFLGWTWVSTATELSALEPRLEQVRAEHKRFRIFLEQKRKQEVIGDSLAKQIATIKSVDGDRYIWPHVMDEVTRALPAYTWLVDLQPSGATASAGVPNPPPPPPPAAGSAGAGTGAAPKPDSAAAQRALAVQFQITGRTVDIQAYTRFLRNLEASPWISDVIPVSAQTVVEQERAVTAFVIRASYRGADSAYIRTVPLSQSVR